MSYFPSSFHRDGFLIYLDHNATTPLLPAVADIVDDTARRNWGNPSSVHRTGQTAFAVLENARQVFADILSADITECIFTSGGTEADNLAIAGVLSSHTDGDIIISAIEHPAVAETAASFSRRGFRVLSAPVCAEGRIDLPALAALFSDRTRLVSIMAANNETGTLQPLVDIGALCHAHAVPFHCDAVQAFGKIPLDIHAAHISLLSLSAHKIGGPRGAGLLYLRKKTPFVPTISGGSQEFGIRPGTQNLAAIAGFAHAASLACADYSRNARLHSLTEELWQSLASRIPGISRNGDAYTRLGGTLNICIPDCPAEMMIQALDMMGICVSAGAACSSGAFEPSGVLMALGRRKQEALCSFRISAGEGTRAEELAQAADAIVSCVERVRF